MVGREALHIVVSHGNREEKREKKKMMTYKLKVQWVLPL